MAGGVFDAVRRPAIALAELGHAVSVLALEDALSAADMAAWAPLKPQVFPRRGPRALGHAPALAGALQQGQFDIVHQHGLWQAFSAQVSAWRRRNGKAVVISPHGMLDPWALANSAWKKRLTGALYENANLAGASCLHALNPAEEQAIRAHGLANPVAVIANGADLPQGEPPAPPHWWPEGKVLLFLGRIHPKKGVAELVEAFAAAAVSGWSCVIAGWDDGGHLPALRAAVAARGLDQRILFPGPLYGADKAAAYAHAAAFILPSHSEGLPMSVLEAWANGLPVLMTAACNLPLGFARGAALEVSTDPAALAASLAAHLPRLDLPALGQKGRALVTECYAWPQIARQHAEVYRWLAGQGAGPPACVRFMGEAQQ